MRASAEATHLHFQSLSTSLGSRLLAAAGDARRLGHVCDFVCVDQQVEAARLVEERQEGHRGGDLPDDGLDLL